MVSLVSKRKIKMHKTKCRIYNWFQGQEQVKHPKNYLCVKENIKSCK